MVAVANAWHISIQRKHFPRSSRIAGSSSSTCEADANAGSSSAIALGISQLQSLKSAPLHNTPPPSQRGALEPPSSATPSRPSRTRPLEPKTLGPRCLLSARGASRAPPPPPAERPVFLLTEFDLASQTRLNHFLINYSKVRLERADFCFFVFFAPRPHTC